MNARPITIQLLMLAIVVGVAAGSLTALVYAMWGPSIPWVLGGGRPVDSPNVVPVVVMVSVTSQIISSATSRLHRRPGA